MQNSKRIENELTEILGKLGIKNNLNAVEQLSSYVRHQKEEAFDEGYLVGINDGESLAVKTNKVESLEIKTHFDDKPVLNGTVNIANVEYVLRVRTSILDKTLNQLQNSKQLRENAVMVVLKNKHTTYKMSFHIDNDNDPFIRIESNSDAKKADYFYEVELNGSSILGMFLNYINGEDKTFGSGYHYEDLVQSAAHESETSWEVGVNSYIDLDGGMNEFSTDLTGKQLLKHFGKSRSEFEEEVKHLNSLTFS
ncbi:hypothetical protein [Priestia aryabhattai]